jgi:hypothetical protein
MTTEVWLVFFLATVSTSAQSLHPDSPCSHAAHACSPTCSRTQPKLIVVFRKPGFHPLFREIRGVAALPRGRCAFSFSQSSGRKHFYTSANLIWCGLNLIIAQIGCALDTAARTDQ